MAVRIVVDGQSFNIKGTDDPDVARKLAKRELRKRSGEFSALGEFWQIVFYLISSLYKYNKIFKKN